MSKNTFNKSKTSNVIGQLNFEELEIWLRGCGGCFQTSRRYTKNFVFSKPIDILLNICVFCNTVTLALDGLVGEQLALIFAWLNFIFTSIFTIEMILKLYGMGLKEYVKDTFNVLDGIVVIISNVELVLNFMATGNINPGAGGSNAVSALRAVRVFRTFRVLRVTRLLRSLRFMQIIIEVISETLE